MAHRRAGKTVACVADLINAAAACRLHMPRYAYIAPYYGQAKQVAWEYLKHYARDLAADIRESELSVKLAHNGALIRLYGADNPDALRGMYLDGVVLDEYGDMRPSVWGSVIRPLLADRYGWAAFIGTPKGRNHFWQVHDGARFGWPDAEGHRVKADDWGALTLPASQTGLLPDAELQAARRVMTEDEYLQEFECSFDAAIPGSYYGRIVRELEEAGHIGEVDYDQHLQVHTAWDLGRTDDTAIWFYQVARGEIRLIDYHASNGNDVAFYADLLKSKPYRYGKHWLPHDARARTLASGGKSIVDQLFACGIKAYIAPDLSVQDGIQAARLILPMCWFDRARCEDGIEALRQYQREYDEERKAFRDRPRHDWCSHPADAFRMLAVSWRNDAAKAVPPSRPRFLHEATANEVFWPADGGVKQSKRI